MHNKIQGLTALALDLDQIGKSVGVLSSQGWNGCRSCKRSLFGSTATVTLARSTGGGRKVSWPGSYPRGGSSLPVGSENLKGLPFEPWRVSIKGLKVRFPAKAIAVTISGEATKA